MFSLHIQKPEVVMQPEERTVNSPCGNTLHRPTVKPVAKILSGVMMSSCLMIFAAATWAETTNAQAQSALPVTTAAMTLDREELENDLRTLENEADQVQRTQGDAGVRRKGLSQKLKAKREYTEFHLRLIERFERIEQRLDALEGKARAK